MYYVGGAPGHKGNAYQAPDTTAQECADNDTDEIEQENLNEVDKNNKESFGGYMTYTRYKIIHGKVHDKENMQIKKAHISNKYWDSITSTVILRQNKMRHYSIEQDHSKHSLEGSEDKGSISWWSTGVHCKASHFTHQTCFKEHAYSHTAEEQQGPEAPSSRAGANTSVKGEYHLMLEFRKQVSLMLCDNARAND
ncbi:hypothetical protein CERSUDRAFT_76776 [Gelatoporia subvermispora B]|uniref:Uncharacterized protein n=1 Tax=Ceriporiopsis subvermispora (strain B) TaxID=914234 RepID=M2Q8A3_CERS8|nr:hypothetical protein CERSUDRAFT_76776 [Gelatoporia subvermispora B]